MRFGAFIVSGLAAVASAALTAQQVADGLQSLTKLARDLQDPAKSITLLNAPLIVIGQGPFPKIISGYREFVTTAETDIIQHLGNSGDYDATDSAIILDAYRAHAWVHRELLNILIGKSNILTQVPVVGDPVAAVLRSVESSIDTISIALLNRVQEHRDDLSSEADSLGSSLELAIKKYEGLSV